MNPGFTPDGLIPHGTLAKVRLLITPGGYNDPERGWRDGWATRGAEGRTVFLACDYTVVGGPFDRRRIRGAIGLYSAKNDVWANMGRQFIRAALTAGLRLAPTSRQAREATAGYLTRFELLSGLRFPVCIEIEQGQKGEPVNVVKRVVEPNHPEYERLMALRSPFDPEHPIHLEHAQHG